MHKNFGGWVVKYEQKINRTIIKEEKEILLKYYLCATAVYNKMAETQ